MFARRGIYMEENFSVWSGIAVVTIKSGGRGGRGRSGRHKADIFLHMREDRGIDSQTGMLQR
jgi:hypothetical protein